ncbi:Rho-GTPase-activating protein 5 [Escovopsis weberi]|uniref:Rho-GTPase-activating protein 5 n=1 Tax=Escovopsis weberi TaxID=150374 RepID=A0A0N0RTI3_ESCWE|nr:Rho-GTPase-activating protein 5 [Escovopsis weberi]
MTSKTRGPGIFGVPLRTSIVYANVAISLVDENGQSYIYGYVPIVVAKCGVFLKEKATNIEGIFRLSGSEKRIKELKIIFDSPDRYGKGLSWDGYTVHDAANVLRRYLNDLPEPVVPLDLYEKFRDPLRGATKQAVGDAEGPQFVDNFNEAAAIECYQRLITELPPLNKQLLLYILDLLAVFAAKSDENRMTSQNLAAIFQPGMLSHPAHAMAPDEYRLNQCVIIFLIENQDHFLIGMQGTAADEKTMKEVAEGSPEDPTTPGGNRKTALGRTASNSSAGAESVRRDGQVRRNRSVSSRHSRVDGSATPISPSLMTTPTGGLGRSNTLPSKRSPALLGAKFRYASPGRAPKSPAMESLNQSHQDELKKRKIPGSINISAHSSSTSLPTHNSDNASPSVEGPDPLESPPQVPMLQARPISQSYPSSSSHIWKRHSPSHSLSHKVSQLLDGERHADGSAMTTTANHDGPADFHHRQTQSLSHNSLRPEDGSRGRRSPPHSIHSSFNGSDVDQVADDLPASAPSEPGEKEKKNRWRISRSRKEDFLGGSPLMAPHMNIGANYNAEISTTSIGSALHKPPKSVTGESSEHLPASVHESDVKGPFSWIKTKYREAKGTAEQRRCKSPPPSETQSIFGSNQATPRGKSLDMKREPQQEEEKKTVREVPPEEPLETAEAPAPAPARAPAAPPSADGPKETAAAEKETTSTTTTTTSSSSSSSSSSSTPPADDTLHEEPVLVELDTPEAAPAKAEPVDDLHEAVLLQHDGEMAQAAEPAVAPIESISETTRVDEAQGAGAPTVVEDVVVQVPSSEA